MHLLLCRAHMPPVLHAPQFRNPHNMRLDLFVYYSCNTRRRRRVRQQHFTCPSPHRINPLHVRSPAHLHLAGGPTGPAARAVLGRRAGPGFIVATNQHCVHGGGRGSMSQCPLLETPLKSVADPARSGECSRWCVRACVLIWTEMRYWWTCIRAVPLRTDTGCDTRQIFICTKQTVIN